MAGLGVFVAAALVVLSYRQRARERRTAVHTDEWRAEAKA
jgi:hypothetical protein